MVSGAHPARPLPGTKYGPAIAVTLSLSLIAVVVKSQLQKTSGTMDRMFAQYQSPQSEASHRRVFGEVGRADPRQSVFNILSWGKDIR